MSNPACHSMSVPHTLSKVAADTAFYPFTPPAPSGTPQAAFPTALPDENPGDLGDNYDSTSFSDKRSMQIVTAHGAPHTLIPTQTPLSSSRASCVETITVHHQPTLDAEIVRTPSIAEIEAMIGLIKFIDEHVAALERKLLRDREIIEGILVDLSSIETAIEDQSTTDDDEDEDEPEAGKKCLPCQKMINMLLWLFEVFLLSFVVAAMAFYITALGRAYPLTL